MKKSDFLSKLKEEGKLELVEPSDEICSSYLEKADNCLKSAKLLYQNNLFENSVSLSYYAMYNSLTALLFKAGIKCENHAGAIITFKQLFNRIDLFKIILSAKEERIDKQYYVASKHDILEKESAYELLENAEKFIIQIKLIIQNLKNKDVEAIKEKFGRLD